MNWVSIISYMCRSSLEYEVNHARIMHSSVNDIHSSDFFDPQQGAEERPVVILRQRPGPHVALRDVANCGFGRLRLHHVFEIGRDRCRRELLHPRSGDERRRAVARDGGTTVVPWCARSPNVLRDGLKTFSIDRFPHHRLDSAPD